MWGWPRREAHPSESSLSDEMVAGKSRAQSSSCEATSVGRQPGSVRSARRERCSPLRVVAEAGLEEVSARSPAARISAARSAALLRDNAARRELDQRAMEGHHRFRREARLDVVGGRSRLFREQCGQGFGVLGDHLSLAGHERRTCAHESGQSAARRLPSPAMAVSERSRMKRTNARNSVSPSGRSRTAARSSCSNVSMRS